MAQKKESGIKFQSVWFSIRGFANEGYYLFGHKNDIQAIIDRYLADVNCRIVVQSGHYTMDAAEKNAERLCQHDHHVTPPHEICRINVMSAAEMLNDLNVWND